MKKKSEIIILQEVSQGMNTDKNLDINRSSEEMFLLMGLKL